MNLFLAALVVFALAVLGMSMGVMVSGRRLRGRCGGLSGLKDEQGRLRCDACSTPSEECAGVDDRPTSSEAATESQVTESLP